MAWQKRTTCQQCSKKLSTRDRKLGTVCSQCVATRATVFDNNDPEGDDE